MKEVHTIVEELVMGKEPRLYSVLNKETTISDSSMRRYSKDNGALSHKELSDEELVRRFVKTHNEEVFSEIVSRYGDKIYRAALRITHSPSDAQDVLQEVFITLTKKIDTFHEDSKFSTWLYRVVVNASFMHLRIEKKRYENNVSLEDYVSYDGDAILKGVEMRDWSDRPDGVLLSKETIEMIESMVSELPELYRTALHLRDVKGLTNYETAKVLDISVAAAKSRIHRARLLLRGKLSDYFPMNGENNLYPFPININHIKQVANQLNKRRE